MISTGGLYGAEKVILELCLYQKSIGQTPCILILQSPGAEALRSHAQELSITAKIIEGSYKNIFNFLKNIRNQIFLSKNTLLHSHGYKTDVLLNFLSLPKNYIKIATCHTWYSASLKLKLFEVLDKLSIKFFDKVIVVSPQLKQEALKFGINTNKVEMIENGVDIDLVNKKEARATICQNLSIPPEHLLIIRIGRLEPSKGNDFLIKALNNIPTNKDCTLLFIGEGEEQTNLESLYSRITTRIDVKFLGFRSDINRLLAASDLFIICSTKEGLPMVLLEAMSASCAIITTDVGAISEVITNDINGKLIEHSNINALQEAMVELLNNDEQRTTLSQQAYNTYSKSYSRKAMGIRYEKVYQNLFTKMNVKD